MKTLWRKIVRSRLLRPLMISSMAIAVLAGPASAADASGVVCFLAPGQQDAARWLQQDGPAFSKAIAASAPGLSVDVLDGNMDAQTQQTQMQTCITKGAKAIVLVSVDENATGGMLNSAAAAHIPVVLYDHNALGGPAAARIYYNFEQTGELQGQALAEDIGNPNGPFAGRAQPIKLMRIFIAHGTSITEAFGAGQDKSWKALIDAGKLKLVCDDWATLGGDPFDVQIQRLSEQCLTRNKNEVDAALSLNDQFATYVLAALNTAGLLGKVPVYGGQDADISGLQNVIRGLQTATVYKPQKKQAEEAAHVVVSLVATGELPSDRAFTSESNGATTIPVLDLKATLLRKSDIHRVVDDGVYTWPQVCVGDVASDPICQNR